MTTQDVTTTITAAATAHPRLAVAAATLATGVVGAIASDPHSRWYRRIDKPAWNPPNAAFPIAWTALYAVIIATQGEVLSRQLDAGDDEAARRHATALGVNLALNAGWSAVFFRAHRPGAAASWAAALAASSTDLVRRTATVDATQGAVLAPYAAWTTFATALTTSIWRRNR